MYTYHDQVELFKSLEHEEKKAICQIIIEFKRNNSLYPTWYNEYVALQKFKHEGCESEMTTEAIQTGAMALRFLTEK